MSMTLISTVTVGSGGAASILFSSIVGTATDLLLVINARSNRSLTEDGCLISFNGSTSSFSGRALRGSGSATASFTTTRSIGDINAATSTSNTFSSQSVYIPNYAGSTNKSFSVDSVSEANATQAWQYLTAGLWSNTAAITSITLTPEVGTAFVENSTASLYLVTKGSGGASVS
jgi:hypothetical protein